MEEDECVVSHRDKNMGNNNIFLKVFLAEEELITRVFFSKERMISNKDLFTRNIIFIEEELVTSWKSKNELIECNSVI
jgi:hypothetical protein